MRRFLGLFVAVLLLAGCPVTDPYRAAIQGSSDVGQAVSSAIKITASYYNTGVFGDAQKATAAKYFTIVTDCNTSFRKTVVAVHSEGHKGAEAFLPIAESFVTCVKNSAPVSADPKVASVFKAIDTAINSVSLAIASVKGGQ